MSSTGLAPFQHGIRQYTPSDKPSILTICKTVYGGRDYIPKTIDSYLKSDSIDVFVHEDETGGGEPTALLCGETSGTLYHVWGARTHPDHRGRGIMTRMMRYMEDRAHSIDTPITHMVSTTIQENRSMLNIFETRGYEHHATVFGWPYTGTPQSLKETLVRHGDDYTSDTIEWVPCRSIEELAEALTMLRAGNQEAPFVPGEGIHSLWIPASYEVISSNGSRIKKALDHASSTGNPQIFIGRQSGMPIAVIARIHSQLGSPIASIVYNQPHLAISVISSAFDLVPDLTRLYIDSCDAGHPRRTYLNETNCNALEEEECHEGWYEYMVLIKPIPLCI